MRFSLKHRFLTASILLASGLAQADDSLRLQTVIVTDTRTAKTIDETLAPVTVIDRDDIDRLQPSNLLELLQSSAGVTLTNNGGYGKVTGLSLRGTNGTHTLVLVDGVKIGSATAGDIALQNIPVEQIERIEVVRGPRSGLYGSEAVGGVIQIFTRRGHQQGATPHFSATVGSKDTSRLSAGMSGGNGNAWYSVNTSYSNTHGYDAIRPRATDANVHPDDDGYREKSASVRAGYRFDERNEIEANWLRVQGQNEYDNTWSANESENDVEQTVYGLRLRFSPVDVWQLTLSGGYAKDDHEDFDGGSPNGRFITERQTGSIQNDFHLGDKHILTIGGDYQNDRVESSTTAYTETSRKNTAGFVQYQGEFFDRLHLQLALRQDDNEQYGHHDTGSATVGFDLNDNLRLVASYGTAFRAPTYNELYWPSHPIFGGGGNPNLKPEHSESRELSLKGNYGWGRWEVNLFQTRIEDLIAGWPATNIDQARIRGVEGVLGVKVAGWDINTALTLLEPENRSQGSNHGNVLPRRAEQSIRIDADKRFGKFSVGATVIGQGRRYDDAANSNDLGSFGTLDLRVGYQFAPDWQVQFRAANVLNEQYETVGYYNAPGEAYYLTVRYQPSGR